MNPTRDTSKGKLPFRFTKLQGLPPETNHHLNEAGTLQRHTQTLQSQTTHQKKTNDLVPITADRWVKQILKCLPFDFGAHIKKIRNISKVGVCCWFCLLNFNAMSPKSSWSVVVHMIYTTTLHLFCTQILTLFSHLLINKILRHLLIHNNKGEKPSRLDSQAAKLEKCMTMEFP